MLVGIRAKNVSFSMTDNAEGDNNRDGINHIVEVLEEAFEEQLEQLNRSKWCLLDLLSTELIEGMWR